MSEKTAESLNGKDISPQRFRRDVSELLSLAMSQFEKPQYADKLSRARDLFFMIRPGQKLNIDAVKPIDHYNFMLWFLCDYQGSGQEKSFLLEFLDEETGRSLQEWEQDILKKVAQSHLSLYDLVDIDPGDGTLILRDLFTMEGVRLQDPRISALGDGLYFFGLRVVEYEKKVHSAGDIYVYPYDMKEQFLMILQQKLVEPGAIVPPTLEEILTRKGYVFNHIQMVVRNTDDFITDDGSGPDFDGETPVEPEESIQEKEKDRVSRSIAHFMLEDYDGARKALESHKSLKFDREGPDGVCFLWHRQKSDKELGTVTLGKRKITFSTLGLDNLESGKSELGKALKPFARHMYDELEKRRLKS